MIIGYGRTSTVEQKAGLEAQERDLKAAGCERVFLEQSSAVGPRKVLDDVLQFVREGDALVVTKLDRLARSVAHLTKLMDALAVKKCDLRILSMGVDTGTPTGKLMLNLLGAIAEFERAMMLERQREGIAKAKAEGKYKGRAPTARAKATEVIRLARSTHMTRAQIAEQVNIGVASVYRILRDEELPVHRVDRRTTVQAHKP